MDLAGKAGALLGKAQETYNAATTPTPMTTSSNVPQLSNMADLTAAVNQMGTGTTSNVGVQQPVRPSPEQIAAQQAMQQRSSLQSNIKNLVGQALGVYDTLYGNLGTAAASQKAQLEKQFGLQEQGMQQEFAQEMPRIGTAYAGRGAYDSSWRVNAENAARDQMLKQLQGLGLERGAQMSALGKSVAEQEAQFKVGQDALNRALAEMATITDVDKLTALQTDIQKRISELEASKAGLQSQEALTQKFQSIGGPTDRAGQVKATIDNILGGAAAPGLKQSVAAGFIQSSGLPQEEQDRLITYLNNAIDRLSAPAQIAPTAPTV